MLPDMRWTLDELCEEAERALGREAPAPADGRVREVPDRRTIRYYTTLGLLDRPAELRGRRYSAASAVKPATWPSAGGLTTL